MENREFQVDEATVDTSSLDWSSLIALAVTLLVWSSAFAAIKAALEHYTPLHLAVLRFMISSLILLPFVFIKFGLPQLKDLPFIFFLSATGMLLYHIHGHAPLPYTALHWRTDGCGGFSKSLNRHGSGFHCHIGRYHFKGKDEPFGLGRHYHKLCGSSRDFTWRRRFWPGVGSPLDFMCGLYGVLLFRLPEKAFT